MGPAGLTAVFGMGTGVTPPVWSPENRPAGGQATPAAVFAVVGHNDASFTPHQKKQVARLSRTANEPFVIWNHVIFHVLFQMSFGSVR